MSQSDKRLPSVTDQSTQAKAVQRDTPNPQLALEYKAAGIGTFEWNLLTNVHRWSPELEAMYGLPPGGFPATLEAWTQLLHPDDRADAIKKVESSFHTREPVHAEWRVVWPDGSIHWIFGRWQALKDESGKNASLTGINIDITEQKTFQEAARQLAAIVESSDDAIVSKDLNGIVSSWNKAAEHLFGYTAEEIIGRSITLLIPPELQSDEEMILGKIRRGQRIEHFETVRITKSGERLDVSLSISPVKDEQGKIIGAAKIARNITDTKRIQQALRTTEKLAAAGRLAATVAHEINNPLEAVTNLVYLAKQDLPDVKKVADHLERAGRELERVAHIARQTLGFYRDTASPTLLNIGETLDDLLLLYETRLEGRKIRVLKQYENDIEIKALSGEIRQAFSNLVTNAIDAMARGGSLTIRVSKSHDWTDARVSGVRVTIADNGSGVAREHKKKLFEPFFTTKANVGTGLGLWISRGIIEKHGGTIRVRSATDSEKHGTVFSLFLPIRESVRGTEDRVLAKAS